MAGLDFTDTSAPFPNSQVVTQYPFLAAEEVVITTKFYPAAFPALTDLWAEVYNVDANNTEVRAVFGVLLRET